MPARTVFRIRFQMQSSYRTQATGCIHGKQAIDWSCWIGVHAGQYRLPAMANDIHGDLLPRFWPETGDSTRSRQWQQSNCALNRLLNHYRPSLEKAAATAETIRRGIDELIHTMEALRRRTCRFCPEPCCITNTVWFDFRDLLAMHLLDEFLPARQAATEPGEACPFLDPHGCRLPWRMRPWMCLKYICPTQLALLKKEGRPDPTALRERIETIENRRLGMETEVLGRIRPRRQTAPSSSSAWLR